jgi:hypothetical protein
MFTKKFLRTGSNTHDCCKCCLRTTEDLRLVRMFLGWTALLSVWLLIFKFDILPPTLKFNLLPPQPCWLAGPTACWPENSRPHSLLARNSRPHTLVGRKHKPCGLLARINRPYSLLGRKNRPHTFWWTEKQTLRDAGQNQQTRQEVRPHTAC